MMDVWAPPRRPRVQRRAELKVQQLLEATESLLCRVPLEFVTTTNIAKQAGLPVSALYRFFRDRQSILDALALEHGKRVREWLEKDVIQPGKRDQNRSVAGLNPCKFLEDLLDSYVAYLDANEGFRVLALGQLSSPGIMPRHASPLAGLPWVLRSFMVERMRVAATPELDLSLRVLAEGGERLIALAYEQRNEGARDFVLEQMKRMLTGICS